MKPKDKYENLLLALLEQRAGIQSPQSYPIAILIDPSSSCQLNCIFCAVHSAVPKLAGRDDFMRAKAIMKLDMFQGIVEEIGPYLFSAWLCNWGEPLLNPRLVDMVRILKEYGVESVGLSSNFAMPLHDETIHGLIEAGLDNITLSIDGATQKGYEKYRVGGNLQPCFLTWSGWLWQKKSSIGRIPIQYGNSLCSRTTSTSYHRPENMPNGWG